MSGEVTTDWSGYNGEWSTHTVAGAQPHVLSSTGDLAVEHCPVVAVVVVVVGVVQVVSLTLRPVTSHQLQHQTVLHQGVVTARTVLSLHRYPGDAGVAETLLAPVVGVAQGPGVWTVLVVRTSRLALLLRAVEAVRVGGVADDGVIFIAVGVDRAGGL